MIPLFLQLLSRIQGVRSLAQTSNDGQAMEDAKRPSKRPKTRRTWDTRAIPTTHYFWPKHDNFGISGLLKKNCEGQWDFHHLGSSYNTFLCMDRLPSVLISRLRYIWCALITVWSLVYVTEVQRCFVNDGPLWMVDMKWYLCFYML